MDVKIPFWVLNAELTAQQKMLVINIVLLTRNNVCVEDNITFAKVLKIHPNNVSKLLTKLNDLGVINMVYSTNKRELSINELYSGHVNENVNPIYIINNIYNSMSFRGEITPLIDYYNILTSRKIRGSKQDLASLKARVKENGEPTVKKVMYFKWKEWGKCEKMAKYYRPSTLFRKSNFDKYMEEMQFEEKRENDMLKITKDGLLNYYRQNAVRTNKKMIDKMIELADNNINSIKDAFLAAKQSAGDNLAANPTLCIYFVFDCLYGRFKNDVADLSKIMIRFKAKLSGFHAAKGHIPTLFKSFLGK